MSTLWTPPEDAVLIKHFPVSGIAGVVMFLEGRNFVSVQGRVRTLKKLRPELRPVLKAPHIDQKLRVVDYDTVPYHMRISNRPQTYMDAPIDARGAAYPRKGVRK